MQRFTLFVLAISILACTGCRSGPKLTPLSRDAEILAFGDSLTYGYGAGSAGGYPEKLAERTGLTVHNGGVNGEVSGDGLNRLHKTLEAFSPDLILLCHGGNDMLRKLDDEQRRENLSRMIELAKGGGADVVLIGVPRPGLLLKTDPIYAELARKYNIPLERKALSRILTRPGLKADMIHPNARGYAELAEQVHRLLQKHGAL